MNLTITPKPEPLFPKSERFPLKILLVINATNPHSDKNKS